MLLLANNEITARSNVLSIVCIYNPESWDKLSEFISLLRNYTEVCLVINAGIVPENIRSRSDLIIYNSGCNLGTLNAYNLVIDRNDCFDYYWLWNQDTTIDPSSIELFLERANSVFSKSSNVAAVTIYDKKNFVNPLNTKCILFKESTTLLRKAVVESSVGYWFDKYFFMDYGDWDLAMRLYKSGAITIQLHNISYGHILGDPEHTLFGDLTRPSQFRLFMQGANFYRYVFTYRRLDFIAFLLLVRTFFVLPFKNLLFRNPIKRSLTYLKGIAFAVRGGTSVQFVNGNLK